MLTVDLTRNEKQAGFFELALSASFGDVPFRYLFYGGAIRGGKTYVCLTILIILCKIFPGSKWYVIRKSFARLTETTIPTFVKILGKTKSVRWNRDKSDYYVEFTKTGSRIYFAGENLAQDPDLNWLLGLECNGFFLEQCEELSEKLLDYSIQRAGSWLIDPMPTPLILGSFNPTQTWIKKKVYEPHLEGILEEPFYYQDANPKDNPFVTAEQWKSWENMDEALWDQFIAGSWDFAKPSNTFAYNYSEKVHHKDVKLDLERPAVLSFDFNVEPITALLCQHDDEERWIHILKEYRILRSDIFELTERIITDHPDIYFLVTGDATGQSKSAIVKGNRNYYQIIRAEMALNSLQIKVPRGNPGVKNTRILTNALFRKHGNIWVNTKACPFLNDDLNGVVVDDKGDIDKGSDKRKTHLLDCLRYYFWTFHRNFLDRRIYEYAAND